MPKHVPLVCLRATLAAILAGAPACGSHAASPAAPAPPRASACADVAASLGARSPAATLTAITDAGGEPRREAVTAAVAEACTADAWSPKLRQCLVDAPAVTELHACEDTMPLAQRTSLKARLAPPARAAGAANPVPVITGVPACDEFLEFQAQYLACDEVPGPAKGAMKESLEQRKQAWAILRDPNVPREALQVASDGCRQGTEALWESATAMGCTFAGAPIATSTEPSEDPAPPDVPYVAKYPDRGKVDWAKLHAGRATAVRACDRFLVMQDRYFRCAKLPQQAKAELQRAMDQQREAWEMLADPNVPAEATAAASDGCQQGIDALVDSAQVLGCPISAD